MEKQIQKKTKQIVTDNYPQLFYKNLIILFLLVLWGSSSSFLSTLDLGMIEGRMKLYQVMFKGFSS